jgi:hypothetical protein
MWIWWRLLGVLCIACDETDERGALPPVFRERDFGDEKRKLIGPFNEHLDPTFTMLDATSVSIWFQIMIDIETCDLKPMADKFWKLCIYLITVSQNISYRPRAKRTRCTASGPTFDDLALSLGAVHNTMHVSQVPRRRALVPNVAHTNKP